MKTDVIKASEEHARFVVSRMTDRHASETAALSPLEGDDLLDVLVDRFSGGVCATLDDVPVAVGEVFAARPNVASLGLVTTDDFPPAALHFTRFLRHGLFVSLRANDVHRIECVTRSDFKAAHRWMGMLGLEKEAEMRKYGRNGEDFTQFAWVAE